MSFKVFYNYLPRNILVQGFTFVEFIVIISIFAIMASIALFNFRGFRSSVATSNLVYDIALELKSAQILGVSAPAGLTGVQTGEFQQIITTMFAYDGNTTPSFSTSFPIFREGLGGQYFGYFDTNIDTIVRTSTMRGGYINQMEICSGGSCSNIKDSVFISFRRPDPEPLITSADTNACTGPTMPEYAYGVCQGTLRIQIVAEDDPARVQYIYVEPSGQIRVASS